ncbi:unnamed protein product [Mytilus edulis]|uniref:Peptidase A9 domain-containing protein n=1 Tax=Mytilus edulis TaxID=6550 RepID=A0A8S3RF09_MYTED|nr:unnamed protein product [Mytilus edulis]
MLVSATGDTADFLGKMKIKIHEVLIADIPSEGILGIDFLEQKMCDIILKEKCLRIDGENVPCFKNREPVSWVGRITLSEDLVLPPSSETIVSANILDPVIKGKTAIVEPSEHFTNTIGLLLAKLVVNTSNSKIPLKILNMNDHECVIYKDTVTAFIEPIAEIIEPDMCNVNKIVTDDETGTRSKNCDLPEHIRPVFESSINELNEQQQIEFKNLLIKHKDSFSKSSADIGRTDLVDHTINTGDALPIRQRPRRIPLAKMEAAEAEIERMAKDGLIEPSTSPWNSPVVMIRKSDLS